MRRLTLAIALVVSPLVSGCASTLKTSMVAPGAPARTPVDGIPYYMPERLVAEVYRKTDKGYVKVGQQLQEEQRVRAACARPHALRQVRTEEEQRALADVRVAVAQQRGHDGEEGVGREQPRQLRQHRVAALLHARPQRGHGLAREQLQRLNNGKGHLALRGQGARMLCGVCVCVKVCEGGGLWGLWAVCGEEAAGEAARTLVMSSPRFLSSTPATLSALPVYMPRRLRTSSMIWKATPMAS